MIAKREGNCSSVSYLFLGRNKERKEKEKNLTKDSFQSGPCDLKRLLKEWQQRTLIKMFMSFNLGSNV